MIRCFACLIVLLSATSLVAEDETSEALLQLGTAQVRLKNFKEARAPLQSAFETSKNDRTKMYAAESLMRVCRETADADGFLKSADYVISNSAHEAARSLNSMQVSSFLYYSGKIDDGIQRYESSLKENPNNIAALFILTNIYERGDRENKTRAKELNEKLLVANKAIATKHAEQLEAEAGRKTDKAAWNLKDAGQFWIEANEPALALAAAKASLLAAKNDHSSLLGYQWREALGDLFLKTGEPELALVQFEEAVKSAPEGILKTNAEKKVKDAKDHIK